MSTLATPSRILRGFDRPYSPPAGYSDFPFTWIYDASTLSAGGIYQNQFVNVQSGYGDFVMRRIVGLDTVLHSRTGQFQIQDMNGRYLQSVPQYMGAGGGAGQLAKASSDLAILREVFYRELSNIGFDLYVIGNGVSNNGFQIGFQGVRRIATVTQPSYKYRPKPYTYVTYGALLGGSTVSPAGTTQVIQPVLNYDFDLYQIYVFFAPLLVFVAAGKGAIYLEPTQPLAAPPQSVTVQILTPVGNNLPLTVTVTGTAIVVSPATNSVGVVTSTVFQVAAAINANVQANALVTAVGNSPAPGLTLTPVGVGPTPVVGATVSQNISWATCLLFDQHDVQIYSQAMLDLFVNAGSYYNNGAIVPPLRYMQNSRIRMDITVTPFQGLETGSGPLWATIHYVGRQRIPC